MNKAYLTSLRAKDGSLMIPEQVMGTEIEASAETNFPNEREALKHYKTAGLRLLNINQWHSYAGVLSGSFQLISVTGEVLDDEPKNGDYIRVDIPGPGSSQGDGFDWVVIEAVEHYQEKEFQATAIRVRPAPNPLKEKRETAHFYKSTATSTFIVFWQKCRVQAYIIDRNLQPNDDSHSLIDKARDIAVGIGALSVFSKFQWQKLCDGLVSHN